MDRRERIWIAPEGEQAKDVVTRGLEEGFSTFLFNEEQTHLTSLGRFRVIYRTGTDLRDGEDLIGRVVTITAPADLPGIHTHRGQDTVILLESNDWKVIPLENLIADFQGTPTRLFAGAGAPEEVLTLLGLLEEGTAGAVLHTADPALVTALARRLDELAKTGLSLVTAEVLAIRAVGLGDRVCVDTASLMGDGEGLLVGSQGRRLALVHAETLESGYVAARPFRVNAGPVHAYTMVPGGRTRYLSELRAGDEVLIVDREGGSRPAVVGRVKVERRPLLLVTFRTPSGEGTLLLQNAETVRLVGKEGGTAVTDLVVGDDILIHESHAGRHFGMPVDETVTEA